MESIQQHNMTLNNNLELISEGAQMLAEQARIHCRFSEREEFHIFISLLEAINNAIVHGNLEVDSNLRADGVSYQTMIDERRQTDPFQNRKVTLKADYSKEQVIFRIENEGPGFDVSRVPDPTQEENLSKPSGRGLLIIRSFFDNVEFNEQGTCLILTKHVRHPVSQPPQRESRSDDGEMKLAANVSQQGREQNHLKYFACDRSSDSSR